MDILSKIVAHTRDVIAERSAARPLEQLREAASAAPPPVSLAARVNDGVPLVIAEFKRKSPSRPNINLDADPVAIAQNYQRGGAAAMSVLTEPGFFSGSPDDLIAIRPKVQMPLLRKDFMVDPYQFYEARAMGADLVLLIARILDKQTLHDFCDLAHSLGMEALCEVHNLEELEMAADAPVDFLGVNCRDLKKFQTNLDHLIDIVPHLPKHIPWVAESGIHAPRDLKRLYDNGYKLFLIGEYLMKSQDPVATLEELTRL